MPLVSPSPRLLVSLSAFLLTAISAHAALLLVADKGTHNLSLVDPVAGHQIATIPEDGNTAHEVIASPDGRYAYVPIYGDSGVGKPGTDGQLIRVMDLQQRTVVNTFDFGKGVRPHCPMIHPKTGLLYVSTELEQSITILDPKTLKIVGTVPTGKPESHMFVISHDGHRAYTANVGSGTVSVLDLDARKLVTVIPVTTIVQRIAVSMDDRWVITADQTKLRLCVIDTQTNTLAKSIPLPGLAYGTAVTPDGKSLVAALPALNQAALIDLATMKVVKTVGVAKNPQEVLISPDGSTAYLSCLSASQIAAIDLTSFKVDKLITVEAGADGLAWAK